MAGARPLEPGSPAYAYLTQRACAIPPTEGDLQWHPALRHPSGHVGPALIALVTDAITGAPLTLHRTWIKPDGSSKAEVQPSRLLWPGLPKAGGVIRLWPDEAVTVWLCIAEGIETALSAARAFGFAWATIDAGNMAKLPVLGGIEVLTIVADHDPANPRTGKSPGIAAANECAARWHAAGCEVRLWRAEIVGQDFNDVARGLAA